MRRVRRRRHCLDQEPVIEPGQPTGEQTWLVGLRADAQAARDANEAHGEDITGWDGENGGF